MKVCASTALEQLARIKVIEENPLLTVWKSGDGGAAIATSLAQLHDSESGSLILLRESL